MSKSLRVSDELFTAAQDVGKLLSRSAVEQVEHWARLGLALEKKGLTVDGAISLLQTNHQKKYEVVLATEDLWIGKRAGQKNDIEAACAGESASTDMGWLGSSIAKKAKILNDIL